MENIDQTSRQLREALEAGRTIIVATLQKFPVIAEQIGQLPGQRFAVIVDEAHSSQSGESTKSLKAVLAAGDLEEAEREEAGAETPEEELENRVLEEIRSRGRLLRAWRPPTDQQIRGSCSPAGMSSTRSPPVAPTSTTSPAGAGTTSPTTVAASQPLARSTCTARAASSPGTKAAKRPSHAT